MKEIFWEGACVVAAHQFLTLHGAVRLRGRAGQAQPELRGRRRRASRRSQALGDSGDPAVFDSSSTSESHAIYGIKHYRWPAFQQSDTPVDVLVKLSRFYGSDPEFVLAGGGNTSVKVGDRLFVKGSGHALATIAAGGLRRDGPRRSSRRC